MISGGLRKKEIKKVGSVNHPLITVATVVFNGEKTLEQTIESVVNQTYDNVEYIIIDGGSTDQSLNIIKKYENKIDYWQSEPDKGIYDAMNKALKVARGDYLIFLGSDDLFFNNNILETVSKYLIDYDCSYYGNVMLSEHKVPYDGTFSTIRLLCRNICHQSIFYSRKTYSNNFYNMKYNIYADWEYNIRSWRERRYNYIPEIISLFNEKGSSQSGDAVFIKEKKRIIKELYGNYIYIMYFIFFPINRIYYFFTKNIHKRGINNCY